MNPFRSAWLHRFLPGWFWVVVIGACVVGGGGRLCQNTQRRASYNALLQQHQLTKQAYDRMLQQLRVCRDTRRDYTKAELEKALNIAPPLLTVPDPATGDDLAQWIDPPTGQPVTLIFRNGVWKGHAAHSKASAPWVPTASDQLTGKLVRSVGLYGIAAWLAAFAVFLLSRKYDGMAAELMLALTLVCGTAYLVSPAYSLTIRGVLSNDMLFWAVLMLGISGFCILWAHARRGGSTEPLCTVCGYNLTGNVSGVCPECGERI